MAKGKDQLVLGLDLSMSSPGFAVVRKAEGEAPALIHASHVKTNSKHSHGQRLIAIERHLINLVEQFGPFTAVAREKGFSQHAMTTQVIFRVVGVSDLALAKEGYTKIVDLSPTTVKKAVAGNGKADKKQVAQAVETFIGEYQFKNDDESDAVAVALAYLIQEGY
jgi:crossover junction endodeoxyribonuclease RuvC